MGQDSNPTEPATDQTHIARAKPSNPLTFNNHTSIEDV